MGSETNLATPKLGRPYKDNVHRESTHSITSFHLNKKVYDKFRKTVQKKGFTISETVEMLMENYILPL